MPLSSPPTSRNPCSSCGFVPARRKFSPQPICAEELGSLLAAATSANSPLCPPWPTPRPRDLHHHLLRDRLFRLTHDLDAQAQDLLLGPPPASPLVTSIDPQMRKASKAIPRRVQQQLDAVFVGHLSAVRTRTSSTKPSVSTNRWRFLPATCLAGSKPRSLPPTPVVLTDCESTIPPALGLGFLPNRARRRSRSAALAGAPTYRRYAKLGTTNGRRSSKVGTLGARAATDSHSSGRRRRHSRCRADCESWGALAGLR